jgi:nitrite reductase (NADH) large subunit
MYVIIGQGAAGVSAAKTLRRLDPDAPVTVVSEEKDHFYSRIDLPDIVAGKRAPAEAELAAADEFAAARITCRLGEKVARILPAEASVELASGERIPYKKLLLATGSLPVLPPIPGIDASGVYTLWTLAQAREIIAAATTAKTAVVVGSGLIGLKSALALAARGLAVTIVEKLPRVMPRQLDGIGAGMVESRLRALGLEVLTNTEVTGFCAAGGAVSGVRLAGRTLACDMVVMAIGVKPNTALAAAAGLKVGRGIAADGAMRTSQPDIFAAGDCAETVDILSGLPAVPAIWPVAVEEGRVAAANMAGQPLTFDGAVAMNSVEIAGVPLVSVGDIDGAPEDTVLVSRQEDSYRKIVVRGSVVRGILCLGDIRQAGVLGGLVLRQAEVGDPGSLLSPRLSYIDLIAG